MWAKFIGTDNERGPIFRGRFWCGPIFGSALTQCGPILCLTVFCLLFHCGLILLFSLFCFCKRPMLESTRRGCEQTISFPHLDRRRFGRGFPFSKRWRFTSSGIHPVTISVLGLISFLFHSSCWSPLQAHNAFLVPKIFRSRWWEICRSKC